MRLIWFRLPKLVAMKARLKSALRLAVLLLLVSMVAACGAPHPWYRKDYDRHRLEPSSRPLPTAPGSFTLYMIGDCGKSYPGKPSETFAALADDLKQAGPNSAVIYLGDNIYDFGLPADSHPDRKEMERRMTVQLEPTQGFAGKVIVIPGNHDWDMGGRDGYAARLREEAFVEKHLDQGNTFHPDQGCPGPNEIALTDSITLLIYDSQWWLHPHTKPGKDEGCASGTDQEFLAAMAAALERNRGKQVIVAAHHPLHSYGAHGGHYHPKFHLFPMLMFSKKLWIPLPVLGTAAVWYRKFHGSIQDLPHPRYRDMKEGLEALFQQYPGLIYISGHDHNLQYLPVDGRHYIVSGSGSKSQYVGHGKRAQFTDASLGYGRLVFEGGRCRLEFFAQARGGRYGRFLQEWGK